MKKKIFAFDLGKTSIGFCVREGHEIKQANSLIIETEHADITSLRIRRHERRTLNSHKAREKYFQKLWQDCSLKPLSPDDEKFKKEFAQANDKIIYNSCLLRIALLQNKKLEEWQIFKALYNAIQRRGYDTNLPWKSIKTDDDKKNSVLVQKYTFENDKEIINSDKYKYPCYYDALRLGLWHEQDGNKFNRCIPAENKNKVRATDYIAPREMVEKELLHLWINAQKQIPELKKYSADEFLYGEYQEAYGSYSNPKYKQYMGTSRDWQGVLGQKIPRFNNRANVKCKLLPKRNACKADTLENVTFVLLMKLKNLRLTDSNGEKIKLSPDEVKNIYYNWYDEILKSGKPLNTAISKKDIMKVIGSKIIDKMEPLKADLSGRSSFCRRACKIMSKIILTGELNPLGMDISEFIDADNVKNGIDANEIRTMLARVGDWNNLYIPDNRDYIEKFSDDFRTKTDKVIGNITNPIVRNRLQIFRDLLYQLYIEYGKPDEVIFEFVRNGAEDSLFGRARALAAENNIKRHEKENNLIRQELESENAYSQVNFEKLKLLKSQCGKCIYSGAFIGIHDFDKCEIDHIYPRTSGGNDAFYNKVLCYRIENQNKGGRTPFEWLAADEYVWTNYVNRLNEIKNCLGKKKYELLTSPPEECAKLIEHYNGLAETSYIAKAAPQITALMFDWRLQAKGDERHIYVNNGFSTAAIRKRYGLNALLGDADNKNRSNKKHHALDAICISYSRDFKYDKSSGKDIIEGFNPMTVRKIIDSIVPYPYTNKKKLKSLSYPEDTMYGLRTYGEISHITKKIPLTKIKPKADIITNIIDEVIKNDLLSKLEENSDPEKWLVLLQNYIHPTKGTHVKRVMTSVASGIIEKDLNGRERLAEYCDFGHNSTQHQFKRCKGHKGQILYYSARGTVKVMPIYSNMKTAEAREKLSKLADKLYNKGEMFYSGCLVNVPTDFKGGKQTYPAGIYKIRTIETDNGKTLLENSCGEKIRTSAANLTKAEFYKINSNKIGK